MVDITPPPLLPPGPPNDTNPDSGLLGKGGDPGGGLPNEILDNYPLAQQASQQIEINLIEAENPLLQNEIKGVLGGLPVAERNQEYFAVVFEAMDTSPEIINQTQFKVTYLCDSYLNVSKPADDTIAVKNITQNFERQKRATVRVDQGTVLNQQLAGTHTITAVGSLEPILGTQIGKGPYEYVTTMSFYLNDQLEGAGETPVVNYFNWLKKQGGYQDLDFQYERTGNINIPNATGNPIGAWTNTNILVEANEDNPIKLHYDGLGTETTGSASVANTYFDPLEANPSQGNLSSLNFDLNNYFNQVQLLTGSLEGFSRVRAKVNASLSIISSSIRDLFLSINTSTSQINVPFKLKVYKSGSEGVEQIGQQNGVLDARNTSLVGGNGGATTPYSTAWKTTKISTGDVSFDGFSWGPVVNSNSEETVYSSAQISILTDYVDVNENDTIYAELYVESESSSSGDIFGQYFIGNADGTGAGSGGFEPENPAGDPWDTGISNPTIIEGSYGDLYTASLDTFKNTNTFRTYRYKWGELKIEQETPPSGSFISGQNGVIASYYTSSSEGIEPTYYNYTSSYWIGYNNTTSSNSSSISYITASSDLSNFYGGQYTQINPGVEVDNLLNANGEVGTSLYINGDTQGIKQTWTRFGFNPINLPFVPIVGDFIRFEYSKSKVFQIIGIDSLGTNLKLRLNKHISPSTVLDNFVIYRIVENGQYIILDVEKNNEAGVNQAFSGIITAQYRSENLEDRSDGLIFDLKQAGIISEGAYLTRRGYTPQ